MIQYWPLGTTASLWHPAGVFLTDNQPLNLASFQPTSLLIHSLYQQLLHEDLLGGSVKGLTGVLVENILCFSLIYQAK